MVPLLNIHTHRQGENRTLEILNLSPTSMSNTAITYSFSTGIHPWYIGDFNNTTGWSHLHNLSLQSHCVALGECGLDRLISTSIADQRIVFLAHLNLAKKLQKPVLVHCVRAFDELIQVCKPFHSFCPIIIHGFNRTKRLAQQLIKEGFYFSFGDALLKSKTLGDCLLSTPHDRFFFETDDADVTIATIYTEAARILAISRNELANQILANAKNVFHDTLVGTH